MPPRASLPALGRGTFLLITGHFPPLLAAPKPCEGGQISACQRVSVSLFLGPHRAVVPKPTDEANRCILRQVTPKTLRKALCVGYLETGKPLQVVGLGWSPISFPRSPPRRAGRTNLPSGRSPPGMVLPGRRRLPTAIAGRARRAAQPWLPCYSIKGRKPKAVEELCSDPAGVFTV